MHQSHGYVIFLGYKIEFARCITTFFGNMEHLLWTNILPNIIHIIIITECAQCISTVQKIQIMQVQGCVIQVIIAVKIMT